MIALDRVIHTPFQDVFISAEAANEINLIPGSYELANRFVTDCYVAGFIVKYIKKIQARNITTG